MIDITKISAATFIFDGVIKTEMPFSTCSKDLAESVSKDKPRPVPVIYINNERRGVIPATGLRGGMLRRPLYQHMLTAEILRTGNETPYTLEAFHMNIIGGVKGSEKNEKNTVEDDAYWRSKNPIISIFGAGAAGYLNMMAGKLCVGNAITQEPMIEYVSSGARRDPFQHDKSAMQHLSEEEKAKYFAEASLINANSKYAKEIEKLTAKLVAAQTKGDADKVSELEAELDEVKKARENNPDKNAIGRPLAGWKAIPQGKLLDHTMRLTRANAIELGAVLSALSTFAVERPFVGAHYAQGNGMISAKWNVSVAGLDYPQPVLLGSVIMTPDHIIELTSDPLKQALKMFNDALAAGEFDLSVPSEEKRLGKTSSKTSKTTDVVEA